MIFLFCTLFLQSCVTKVNHHGYIFDKTMIAKIKEGSTTKNEVLEIFGSPSDQSKFGEETWHYISYQTISKTFSMPKINKAEILTITFNNDLVKKVSNKHLDKSSIAELKLDKDRTQTITSTQTTISHFVKNFRKYNQNLQHKKNRRPSGI